MNTNPTLTAIQAAAIADFIREQYGDDEDLIIGMVEGETDAGEMLDGLLAANMADAAMADAIKAQEQQLADRRKRVAARVAARREGIRGLLDTIGLKKWERPLATVSLRDVKPKRVVTDEALVPDEFCKITRSPVMAEINKAPDLPPGVTLDNGGVSLTVRVA